MIKKLLVLTAVFLSSILNIDAQIRLGLNSGVNLTSVSSEIDKDRWDTGFGFRVGGFSEIEFGKFGLHLEIDYSYVCINGSFDDKIVLNYASLPVTVFYRPIKQLRIFVGPEINFLLDQSGPTNKLSFGEEDFEKLDYGVHAEIEFLATKRLGISIRNYFGLQFNGEIPKYGSSAQEGVSLNKLNIFGLNVNYYLGKDQNGNSKY